MNVTVENLKRMRLYTMWVVMYDFDRRNATVTHHSRAVHQNIDMMDNRLKRGIVDEK